MKNKKNTDKKPESKIKKRLKEWISSPFSFLTLITVTALFILMLIIFLAEQSTNSQINTFFDAFWYTLVTITTVGYGDIAPASVTGRVAAMVLLLAGVAIFGALSGKFASFLFDRQQKKDKGLLKMQNMKNHFIILGWKPDFDRILEGIISANTEISIDKIVLVNNAPQTEIEKIKNVEKFKNLNWVKGDFTDDSTLLKAQIKTAERALVLADYSENFSTLEIDSRTVLAAITIKNLNPKIYCVAEILNSKFEKHLSLAHCDEIILSTDYEMNILFQASSGKGMSHILRKLIEEDSDAGILIQNIEEDFIGKTYGDYRKSLSTKNILVGLLENTGNFYHRRNEALAEAQKNPNMEQIVTNLKKVKTLKSNLPHFIPFDDYIIPRGAKAIFIYGESSK